MKDALLLIEGKLRFDEFANTWVLRATKVSELERLREKEARRIVLKLASATRASLEKLQALLAPVSWRQLPGRGAVPRRRARAARFRSAPSGTCGPRRR